MKQFVVVGRSRSGTSLVSGMLHFLGIDMHPSQEMDHTNPKGSFEDVEWIKLIFNVQNAIKTNDLDTLNKYKEKIQSLVELRNKESGDGKWGFKVATFHEIYEHITQYLSAPAFVFIFRNPLNIAYSDVYFTHGQSFIEMTPKLRDFKISTSFRFSAEYLLACEKMIISLIEFPRLYVDFEEMRKDPLMTLEKIAEFTGIGLTQEIKDKVGDFFIPNYCSWESRK